MRLGGKTRQRGKKDADVDGVDIVRVIMRRIGFNPGLQYFQLFGCDVITPI